MLSSWGLLLHSASLFSPRMVIATRPILIPKVCLSNGNVLEKYYVVPCLLTHFEVYSNDFLAVVLIPSVYERPFISLVIDMS
jgi:hypothetical protein